jgi:hypothetical protein
LNELGNEELLSANKDESGCNGCEATARLSNQETRNDGSGKHVTDSLREN